MRVLDILLWFPIWAVCSPITVWKDFNPTFFDKGLYGAYLGHNYVSFDLVPPKVAFVKYDSECSKDYTLISPRGRAVPTPGPMILDANGDLVWMEDRFGQAMDFRVQRYAGEDYLTFWLNSSYDVAYAITTVGDLQGDLHEFQITENGTALMTAYDPIQADLSSVGGASNGWIFDSVFQEVDIESGELLFQWRASDHYQVNESFASLGEKGGSIETAWDYFHINSIDKDSSGNYYISSRYMHTVTCIRPSGEIAWILGGERNDFKDLSSGAATNFTWQHHVRWHPGNIITIFDNGAFNGDMTPLRFNWKVTAKHSRGLEVQLDLDRMTASLVQDYVNPHVLSHSQGSVQLLDNGNVFVGWGHTPAWAEFAANGTMLCDAHFGPKITWGLGLVKSYRTSKGRWTGRPRSRPSIELQLGFTYATAYVSWNGATEVQHWRLESTGNPNAANADFVQGPTTHRKGFETAIGIPKDAGRYIRFAALDKNFRLLKYTELLNKNTGHEAGHALSPVLDRDILPLRFLVIASSITTAILLLGRWCIVMARRRAGPTLR